MKIKEFCQEIEKTYNKYFPTSKCFANYSSNLYRTISIKCFLAGDNKELSGNYWDNDLLGISFSISTITGEFKKDITEESIIPENLMLEVWHKHYFIKPSSRNMVYDHRSLAFRKTKGDNKKILQTLDKYFKKLYESLAQDMANNLIPENHKESKNIMIA